jgi:hypothetical protein
LFLIRNLNGCVQLATIWIVLRFKVNVSIGGVDEAYHGGTPIAAFWAARVFAFHERGYYKYRINL